MNGSGILMLAGGLVVGLLLGQAMKQCPVTTLPTQPAKGANVWDFLIGASTAFGVAAKDIFD
jgi:hypothetical protein